MEMKTVRQCKSCPFRIDCEPDKDIPGYDVELAKRLANTCKTGLESLPMNGMQRVMACHYSKPGEEFPCAGWLYNGINQGNNIGVRLGVMCGRLPAPEIDGEQHETYEATLPKKARRSRK